MTTPSTPVETMQRYSLDSWEKKIFSSWKFWVVFSILIFAYPIIRSVNRELPDRLPVYFELPSFELTDQFGKKFGSSDLKGKVYLANFMFTTCPSTCPALMEKMRIVQKRIRGVGNKMNLVTFTVDPEHDTSDVLREFSMRNHANPFVWKFLTGEEPALKSLLIEGFKVTMGGKEPVQFKSPDNFEDVTLIDIAHSEKIVLVDQLGRVRGYYSTDKIALDQLMIDVGLLINMEPKDG